MTKWYEFSVEGAFLPLSLNLLGAYYSWDIHYPYHVGSQWPQHPYAWWPHPAEVLQQTELCGSRMGIIFPSHA